MTKKQTIIVIALTIVVLIGIAIGLFPKKEKGTSGGEAGMQNTSPATTTAPIFSPEVPKDATLTVPVHEAPAAPNVPQTLGIFDMTVAANGFEPNSITVKNKNLVTINLTAADGDYDFSMPYTGLYTLVKKGETKQISFQATGTGTFVLECRDYCPKAEKIQGTVIVLP